MALSRRSFLVVCGGALLGTFALPENKQAAVAEETVSEQSPVSKNLESHPRIRHMLTAPKWSTKRTTMVWMESSEGEDVKVMVWSPKTEEEWEEAERFYAAANYRTWRTFDDLKSQTRQLGLFVIRWVFQPHVRGYINTTDEALLSSERRDLEIFTEDPHEAGQFDHATAIRWVLRLMERNDLEEGSVSYYDTILLKDAIEAHRLLSELQIN